MRSEFPAWRKAPRAVRSACRHPDRKSSCIAHPEDAFGNAVGMKLLQGVEFFAHTHELERLIGDGTYGQGRASARVAIHLGENHSRDPQPLVEFIRGFHRI